MFIGGGGIYNLSVPGYDSLANIINSTISGNDAWGGEGGGILNDHRTVSGEPTPSSTVNVTNSTISNNSALVGGGIFNASGNTVNAANKIMARNVVIDSPDFGGELTSQDHNLVGDNSGAVIKSATGDQIGTSASPIDPLLGPLQDNGGPTETQALLTASTAIDAGNDAVVPPRDQRGYVRSGVSDIGAFEFAGTIPVTLATFQRACKWGITTMS